MRISSLVSLSSVLLQAGWLASTASAAPIETAGPSLTLDTWDQTRKGTWFVEHYSPYCSHCKAFAPTWKEMVALREKDAGTHDFHFAQVDCAANGDLCHQNGVKYYPSIYLYVNGEQFDEYSGKRSIEALNKYIDDNLPAKVSWGDDDATDEGVTKAEGVKDEEEDTFAIQTSSPDAPNGKGELDVGGPKLDDTRMVVQVADPSTKKAERDEDPAADGLVHIAGPDEIGALRSGEKKGAGFVKYYAPWCGHCKTLAPRWIELASQLKGQVNVYEVDCEDGKNKKVCKQEGVKAYPSLKFYMNGESVDYNGKRDVETMKLFAQKALSATQIKPIADQAELNRAAAADEVIFLFLHPKSASEDDLALASATAKSLLGGAPFYTSSSQELFARYGLTITPTLLAFKDFHSTFPASTFPLPPSSLSPRERLAQTKDWLATAKLPTLSEVNAETYASVMRASGSAPYVGLAVLSRARMGSRFEEFREKVKGVAGAWGEKRRGMTEGEKGGERDVVWAWVDGDKWAQWIKTMYEVKAEEEPTLIIVDTKELKYWKKGLDGAHLPLDRAAALDFIERGVYGGEAVAETSRTLVQRIEAWIGEKASYFALHPFAAVLGLVAGWILLLSVYRAYNRRAARLGGHQRNDYAKLD